MENYFQKVSYFKAYGCKLFDNEVLTQLEAPSTDILGRNHVLVKFVGLSFQKNIINLCISKHTLVKRPLAKFWGIFL